MAESPEKIAESNPQEKPTSSGHLVESLAKLVGTASGVINDKLARCEDFKEGKYGNVPTCYTENSPKEELVLEHVLQYKKQFKIAYDPDRELYLCPKNECDVYKFICTTLRPTKMGYLELYEYEKAAKFIADFIQYEELDPPDQYPTVIPSPTNVMKWQKGDSFDMSILLCSILLGTGYDAYVVIGEADMIITTKNETYMEYEKMNTEGLEGIEEDENVSEDTNKESEFGLNKKPPIISKYDTETEERFRKQKEEEERKARTINDEIPEKLIPDPYEGCRKHAWILLKAGKRGVEKDVFIEPTTGRMYPLNCEYYLTVDSVFNNRNFWINMQPETPCEEVNFEDMNTLNNWEYVMLDTMDFANFALEGIEDDADMQPQAKLDEDKDLKDAAQVLDMPPPWPPKIILDYDAYHQGTPLGEGCIFYSKCTVENYAEYSQVDGLVKRITIYEDYRRLKVKEIRCLFKHRVDKLRVRRRFPFEFKTVEYYDPNLPHNWKKVTEIDRRRREIIFYPNRNVDGLIRRVEIIGEKTIEYYQNRDDRVIYRSIRFEPRDNPNTRDYSYLDNHVGTVVISKLTQKFERNPNYPANEQIAKMVVNIPKMVRIIYHLEEGQIYPLIKEIPREAIQGQAKLSDGDKKMQDSQEQRDHKKVHDLEKECYTQMKNQEHVAKGEIDDRRKREDKINEYRQTNAIEEANKDVLEKTLHDKAKERYKYANKKKDDEESQDKHEGDFLYPILARKNLLKKEHNLDYKEALEVRNECLSKLKERILARAEIIQKRLEEEKENLMREEAKAKKGQMKQEEEKDFDEKINRLQFRIEILDQRASRFEVQALERYEALDKWLNNDKRLAILHTQKKTLDH